MNVKTVMKPTVRTHFLEKDFQTSFNRWLKALHYKTGVFELKATPTTAIPFSAVQEHQEAALYAAKHGNFVYKIPDAGFQTPFDCLMFVMVPAYVVVMFHSKDRGQKEFVLIPIDLWLSEKANSERKSLTEERAKEIGQLCFLG